MRSILFHTTGHLCSDLLEFHFADDIGDWGVEQIENMIKDLDAKGFVLKVEEVNCDCEGAEVEL